MARENGLKVHLAKDDGTVLNLLERDDLQAFDEGGGFDATVRLDQADDDVDALATHEVRVFEHAVGFAHARSGSEIDTKAARLRSVGVRRREVAHEALGWIGRNRRRGHPASTGCRSGSATAMGSVKRNVVPAPSRLSTETWPPCDSTRRRTSARPSPVPPLPGSPVNLPKMVGRRSASMPRPLSWTKN